VFVGGKFIGGATETDELHKSGELTEILRNNNIL
jgi:glutaredoxin-related protein